MINIAKELILLACGLSEKSEYGNMMNESVRCKGRLHVRCLVREKVPSSMDDEGIELSDLHLGEEGATNYAWHLLNELARAYINTVLFATNRNSLPKE
jgi:hypothetical protein